jgi:hypothetical protein
MKGRVKDQESETAHLTGRFDLALSRIRTAEGL